ncbi:acyl-[ACP]--phospholipid O-acyltransferase [Rodentibacter caecimuris]|uniref:Acyl-[ACP]--phospholipid O-acyltransferase n=1 Tax=Rodentibacter caecimuris TaxID=1796644 RepID=A0AAJ3MYH6_9PAST|nr:acyl-[ACP]--phospholipid O-acyltransferase [Rodentibacter heylii]AOF53221.1 Putative 2-acylglycerophosphoethanolamine acyltransferase / acyl-acyl carrier protein synthetase [Pasteurellaceae bacterium NI1060]MCQ9123759.1 acyl-[ACP]--phospholipid O-acyltransferase [Rodentibacter heylii]OOF70853.1 acyl-[ACP]--phospholipid O-acyltransferase [Rodentibacter heylii]OOF72603.1 acyl-[ACP]--phospholipid O-acyltransferase [Rodentibacter heylii]OOF78733.1 acyl-[ACP]--phospholipid O-acyltransferase [Rod
MKLLKYAGFVPYLAIAFLNASVDLAHKITIQNVLLKSFEGNTLVVLTALINAMILLPFIFLFSPSAFINDKFCRTRVIRWSSLAVVGISTAILFSYVIGEFYLAFALTLILAAQSAVYSPAKYSLIKSIVGTENIGFANGVIQALTIVAILFSSFAFSIFFESYYVPSNDPNEVLQSVWMIGIGLVVFSSLEAFFAFKIPFFPQEKEENETFSAAKYFSFGYLKDNLRTLRSDKNIWLSVIGLSLFWGVAQVIVAAFPAHYKALFNADNAVIIQAILAVSGLGLIIGSYLAGRVSRLHVELGIVPVGALGIFVSLFGLTLVSTNVLLMLCSFGFGFFGGLFIVPLNSTIQYFAPEKISGKIMAGNNFIQNIFMVGFLLLSIVFVEFSLSTNGIFLTVSAACLLGSLYAMWQLPHLFIRLLLLPLLKTNYRFHVEGLKNLPQSGGVLMLGNHISWIDWMVLQAASPRAIKFVMFRPIYNKWYLTWFLRIFRVIPISAGSSRESIETIREYLVRGEVVALFPEGHISYNGQINEFKKGFEHVLKDLDNVTTVPFYLRGLWGSSFSRADSFYKNLTKKQGKREILVAFGKPIHGFIDAVAMKQKVLELSFSMWEKVIAKRKPITHHWLNSAKSNLFKECVVDGQGMKLNNLKFIAAVLMFGKQLKHTLGDEKNVGVLLPSSAIGAIVNMALMVMGKVPVNLNYTLSPEVMEKALAKANINKVITAEKFLNKLNAKGFAFDEVLAGKTIFAEQLGKKMTKSEKVRSFLTAFFAPRWWIKLMYFADVRLNDTATILFSSGSEGTPKGIELSHKNLLTNIKQVSELLNFQEDDVILNSLPIFHSFGLTVTTLMPLCEGIKMVSVADPTDGAEVGKMCARHNVSIIFGTSTFFRLYARNKKLHPLMLQSVRMVIAGAEKLKADVKEAFRLKFGLEIYEGYGATETAPVASVNMPNILDPDSLKEFTFNKVGTVGMPLPGTIIKIVDPNTLVALPTGEDGLILIGGGQVMKGYLADPEKTNEVIVELDGVRYYKTGDKGHIDENGFITIVDRYSRFAKIGGEMISLGSVEENIAQVLNDENQFVAIAVNDEKKGESVVLLVKSLLSLEEINTRIKSLNVPPIMLPSQVFLVNEIPLLGSGKVDFKGAKKLAEEILSA